MSSSSAGARSYTVEEHPSSSIPQLDDALIREEADHQTGDMSPVSNPDTQTHKNADTIEGDDLAYRNMSSSSSTSSNTNNAISHNHNPNNNNNNNNNNDSSVHTTLSGAQAKEEDQPPKEIYTVFSYRFKLFLILMTTFATLFSPFSSFIYLPALNPIAESYHRSLGEINLTVTIYQIMQALAPLFFGDLSDQIGRRPVYMLTFALYLGSNIGLALQNNYAALMVLRALQSSGSSATVAIGSAVIADVTTSAERGAYVTYSQMGVMFAPALAPVLGGILTQYLGWRSTFWFLAIAAGVFLAIYLPFMPETARKIVGNGSIPPPRLNTSLTSARIWAKRRRDLEAQGQQVPPRAKTTRKLPIPDIWSAIRIAFEKDVGLLLLFMALVVMANYAVLIPLQDVIRRRHNFNDLQTGLCFIPFAVGSVVGAAVVGRLLNWHYAKVAKSVGMTPDRKRGDDLRKFPIERARLDLIWPWTALSIATTLVWGWVVDSNVNLAAPLVILFLSGLGLAGPASIMTTLLVDLYPQNPGRVSSTFNLTRAAFSAAGTAVIQYIIQAWGYGLTYVFIGLLLLVASPLVWIVRTWGPGWREERYQRVEEEQRKTKELVG